MTETTMTLPDKLCLIKGLEEQLHDRAVRSSPEAVAALLSDDFLEFGRSGGMYKKEAVLSALAAEGNDEPSELIPYGYELRPLAKEVLLLTYRTVRKREGAAELHTLRSSIWKLIDRRWQMAFHQATPTTPEI
jgi:hypothetical protein